MEHNQGALLLCIHHHHTLQACLLHFTDCITQQKVLFSFDTNRKDQNITSNHYGLFQN